MVFGHGRHARDLLGRLQRAPDSRAAAARAQSGIAVSTTHDRYTDDVHCCGGCVYQPMLDWATSMLAYNARPADPTVVDDGWRDLWLTRLEGNRPFIESWLGHQRRDDYWLQGSVAVNYEAIRCAVYVVSG
jgi:predicted acyl esterase